VKYASGLIRVEILRFRSYLPNKKKKHTAMISLERPFLLIFTVQDRLMFALGSNHWFPFSCTAQNLWRSMIGKRDGGLLLAAETGRLSYQPRNVLSALL
jgi:hypothetical protein